MLRLNQFQGMSFDCYGTLIDWEGGIVDALAPLVARLGPMKREQVLATFARFETLQEHETPGLRYSELLTRVYQRLALEWGVSATTEHALAFGASVGDWRAFPDTVEALHYLQQHYRLVILSNVDRPSFAATSRRLGVEFDAVYTAEAIGSYKPALRNFEYLLEHVKAELGLFPDQLLHVAQSLYHDHVPANQLGLASAWIDRRHAAPGAGATPVVDPPPRFDFRFTSLAELVHMHRTQRA